MKKWDDLVEETMTLEAISRSDARAKAIIAQIHSETAVKKEAKRTKHMRHIDHGKHTSLTINQS